jgi:hypothetical protein
VSDTQRTATEQLLLSDAIDRAVDQLDFHFMDGKKVYLDASAIKPETDAAYLASSLRQQMAAHGCLLEEKRQESDYVVEARSGAIGTDHEEVLVGMPATTVPAVGPMTAGPATIPEVPIVKRTEQRGVAKISLFAYNRRTGHAVWQSGAIPTESRVKDLWVLGAGPFQRGQIVDGMHPIAQTKRRSAVGPLKPSDPPSGWLSVGDQAFFREPLAAPRPVVSAPPAKKAETKEEKPSETAATDAVVQASHNEPVAKPTADPSAKEDGFWQFPAEAALTLPSLSARSAASTAGPSVSGHK